VEWCELDTVAIDFTDVQVFADFGDVLGGDVVGGAPDAFGGIVLGHISALTRKVDSLYRMKGQGVWGTGGSAHVVRQSIPMLLINQRNDAAWSFGGAAVVFAVSNIRHYIP
jgi:hypothetical protein